MAKQRQPSIGQKAASRSGGLAQFITAAPAALAFLDADLRYTAWSKAWARLHGFGVRDLAGVRHQQLRPDSPASWCAALRRALETASGSAGMDSFTTGGRRTLVLRWRVEPVADLDGAVAGLSLYCEAAEGDGDHETEQSKRQRLETIGRLAGVIAHDFNNLLTVILANLELAAFRIRNEDARGLLRRASEAAEMGASFNKRLLALAGGRRSAPAVIKVNRHITDTWQVVERVLSEDTRLQFHPGADVWPVKADPGELDGAILNLVANARDAVEGRGEVTIATKNVQLTTAEAARIAGAMPGDFVRISVADTGSGMPSEVAEQAMEPFFTTKPTGAGSGLGLTSVGMTVARAGGFLLLDSIPGEGTTVSLYLPRTLEVARDPDDGEDADLPFGDGQLVLVVEDDPLVREAVLQRLEVLGYAVLEAADGEAALALLKQGEPVDLVFSDVVMPGRLSGYDLALLLRRRFPGVGVLLTSGYASRMVPRRRRLMVRAELIAKPYSLQVLARAVRRALLAAGKTER